MNTEQIKTELITHHVDAQHADEAVRVLHDLQLDEDVRDFHALSAGMTNRLFYLRTNNVSRLIRMPGEESDFLVDRAQEARIYHDLDGLHISDRIYYINPESGIKVTEFIEGAHACDPLNPDEVADALTHLRDFHEHRLTGYEPFDLRQKILAYEGHIRHDIEGALPDYSEVRKDVLKRLTLIEAMEKENVLCHIDSVHENFILNEDKLRLIDWEYAAQCDPHVDIAMFCIYAGYGRERIHEAIDLYFGREGCSRRVREKIFHYTAICGLLWTLWCEIKRDVNVRYDDYEKIQYGYAKMEV